MKKNFEELLLQVEKPGRYIGGEYNTPDMKKPHKLEFCLCFTDIYEVAMSNQGIAIVYDILNNEKDIIAERCFSPWLDMGKLLKENDIPLMSIETKKNLKDFDILGFSIQYELCYTNILYMLDLAQIPFRAKDRGEEYPLIIAGGPCTANPEPYAEFFDIIYIGDGEDINNKICNIAKKYPKNKKKILEEVSKLDGIYVPGLSKMENGINITKIKKYTLQDLDKSIYPLNPLVPNIEVIHDRAAVELFRGCYAGCRFCQACFFYRPIRYREKDTIVNQAKEILKNTGFDEIGLSSLSTGDYQDIFSVIKEIKQIAENENVSFQLPSLRLDSFTSQLMKSSRKSSLTFAPEAGTQRLRNVINKNITDEDIEKSIKMAFEIGYSKIKLYFMMGLPTETDEDILGIAEIVRRIQDIYFEVVKKRNLIINVSTALFIPKPLTPFQWVKQIDEEEMNRRVRLLRNQLQKYKGVKYHWHSPQESILEGIFARGDRKLSYTIEKAYEKGCYFDGWSEYYKNDKWLEALKETNTDTNDYIRERTIEENLPWDFIDFGVSKEYLKKEYEKAKKEQTTNPCKYKCNNCGANKLGSCRQYKGENND